MSGAKFVQKVRKKPKKGQKIAIFNLLKNNTIFLSNSTQTLTKFLPPSTPVEDGRYLLKISYGFCPTDILSGAVWWDNFRGTALYIILWSLPCGQ